MTLQERADEAVRAVLRTQYEGVPALWLDSPPGAGKTGVVERVAVQNMALLDERTMIITQTNEQAFDAHSRSGSKCHHLNRGLFCFKSKVPSGV